MRGVFDDEEPEAEQPRSDTELTLSSTALLAIFFGLILLCGLCFGWGYVVGRRGSEEPSAASQAGAEASLQEGGSRPKPSAITQNNIQPAPPGAVADLPASAA